MFSLLITHGKAYFMDEHKNRLLRQHPDIRLWNAGSGCVAHKTGCSHIQHVCRSDIFVLIHDAFHFNRKISLARMCKYNLILFSRNLVNRVFPFTVQDGPPGKCPTETITRARNWHRHYQQHGFRRPVDCFTEYGITYNCSGINQRNLICGKWSWNLGCFICIECPLFRLNEVWYYALKVELRTELCNACL